MGDIPVSICDLDGKVLLEVLRDPSEISLQDGLCLTGADLMMVDLRRANLRNADLYWAMIHE
jgi:uncharacterized protein YjbI with pentapeptide repeats